jgi:hypothetical protein
VSYKPLLLHYVLNSILMGLKLAPITPASGVKFMRLNSYSPRYEKQTSTQIDVVITQNSIEMHSYSPDVRERHFSSIHSSTKQFLEVFIKQRISWAVSVNASSSPAAIELNGKSDYETFKNAADQLLREEKKLTEQYQFVLERKLNGVFVKVASQLIGF